jgi:5,10-methylenetetrahydromethanopterin reductase
MVEVGLILNPERSIEECVELAKLAEKQGFGYFFLSDSPIFTRDTSVALTAVALNTSRIKVGTAVANPFSRHPMLIASWALSIYELARRRMVLGLGAGATAPAVLGLQADHPLQHLRESIGICRRVFRGETVEFRGSSGRVGRVNPSLIRGPYSIPVYLAAGSPGTLSLAGELADGVMASSFLGRHMDYVKERIREGAQRSARSLSKFKIANAIYLSVAEKSSEARRLIKESCIHLIERTPPSLLELWMDPEKFWRIHDAIKREGAKFAEKHIDDEVIDASAIAGDPEECVEKCVKLMEAGVQLLIFNQPLGRDKRQAIKLIGKRMNPYLQEADSR